VSRLLDPRLELLCRYVEESGTVDAGAIDWDQFEQWAQARWDIPNFRALFIAAHRLSWLDWLADYYSEIRVHSDGSLSFVWRRRPER
jgi:hypothetical protein